MSLYSFNSISPKIGDNCYITDDCTIIGDCRLEDNVNIWFKSILRGDVNKIVIGENTNIQDLCMLHVTEKTALTIGKNVSVGHSVTLHGADIGEGCLIGMGAVILDGVKVGKNSLVAAGSLLPPGKEYPEGSMIMGNPAKVTRKLRVDEVKNISNHYKSYLGYAKEFNENLVKLD